MRKNKDLIWYCSLEEEKRLKAETVAIEIYSESGDYIEIDDLKIVFNSILEYYNKLKIKDKKIIVHLV